MQVKSVVLICVLLLGAVYYTIRRDVIQLDGFRGEILALIALPDTRYAKHYSNTNFAKVQHGMTEAEVVTLLGEPLRRWSPYRYTNYSNKAHYVGLQYSESPSDTHYRLRQIYLDSGKVVAIFAYYYLD